MRLVSKVVFLVLALCSALSCSGGNEDIQRASVDGIPLIYINPPSESKRPAKLVIWQDGFTGSKQKVVPQLRELASLGVVALSYDNAAHGQRAIKSDKLWQRVFKPGSFRSEMWPIIGQSVKDASKVIDWAIVNLGVDPASICMGGYSMGGDIAVAVAGVDDRVRCVVAIVSTPEWTRPHMERLDKPGELVKQGAASGLAQAYYDQYNPATHISRYSHLPAITFESGLDDFHIPASDAVAFVQELKRQHPQIEAQVVLHDAGHTLSASMWSNAMSWFAMQLGIRSVL